MWLGFWWLLVPLSFVLGMLVKEGGRRFALGAGVAWSALAFIRDGRNASGVIAERLAGMFSLPNAFAFFIVLALLGFVTALLWFRAGREVRVLIKR
jgi:hypothetical protein